MAFEFDCPQYYDFETGMDESNPEAYFETIHDISPFSQDLNSVHCDPNTDVPENFPVNSEPYKNTRLSLKNSQSSRGLLKTISTMFRSKKEPPTKKSKVMSAVDHPASKIPASTVKGSGSRLWSVSQKPLTKQDTNLQQQGTKRPLTRTVPEPFSFATDKRLKRDVNEKTEYKPFDYASILRSNKENQSNIKTGPVRAVPDRLLRKRRISDKKTMAEELLSFQQGRSAANIKGATYLSVTMPVTPQLRTASRSRPPIRQQQVEAQGRHTFKAPLEKPNITLPRVAKKPNAALRPFTSSKTQTTEKRADLRPRPTTPNNTNTFKARPIPKRILQGVTGLGVRAQIKPTEAHSPAFVLKKRADMWKEHQAKAGDASEANRVKAIRSRGNFISCSVLKIPTKVQGLPAKKGVNVKQASENKQKVNKVKTASRPVVRESVQKATEAVNPKFLTELQERARSKAGEWQKKMEEEIKRQRDALLFKARPCRVTRAKPFQPVKSNKPPTKSTGFQFQSDLRLQQRKKTILESEQKVDMGRKAATEEVSRKEREEESAFLSQPIKCERVSIPGSCGL